MDNTKLKPKYSICMCNYNMEDTLERALTSILDQLNKDYEVLVVDDGSSDSSVAILEEMARKYSLLRIIPLQRDKKRKLGETRNISIREAYGEYVILHVDADDVWEPYIQDFVKVFHKIESCIKKDILLSGQQINIARRDFLLSTGPYRNIYYTEDRDMWLRLAAQGAYIPFEHRVFRERISRERKKTLSKTFSVLWYVLLNDMRSTKNKKKYALSTFIMLFDTKNNQFSLLVKILRILFTIPVYTISKFMEPLPKPDNMQSYDDFVRYREKMSGDYDDIMKRNGCPPDLSFLSPIAQEIFRKKSVS